jgi:uncharacterized protein (DUF433 family)
VGKQHGVVETDPGILDGLPVFAGTRVPVRTLIDYIEGGERLDDFLEDFPTVSRAQVTAALEIAPHSLIIHARPAQ